MILSLDIKMEKLSIWNDFTTIKQRYLNVLHGMTRIDEHPRRLHNGRNMHQIILTCMFKNIALKIKNYNIPQDYAI